MENLNEYDDELSMGISLLPLVLFNTKFIMYKVSIKVLFNTKFIMYKVSIK
jgi:hypothetical protein